MAATGLALVMASGMVALVSARATLAVDRTMDGKTAVYGPRLDINHDGRIDHADRAVFQRTFYVSLGVGVLGLGVGTIGLAWLRDTLDDTRADLRAEATLRGWLRTRLLRLELSPALGTGHAGVMLRWQR